MSNIIKYSIGKLLNHGIPKEILELAFIKNEYNGFNTFVNLEKEIENKIIKEIVLPDCNIYGGTEVLIDTSRCQIIKESATERTIKVPLEFTNGKKFNSISNVCFYAYGGNFSNSGGAAGLVSNGYNNPIISLTSQLLSSVDNIIKPSSAKCDLLIRDNNVIRMYDTSMLNSNIYYIRATLEYDQKLADLPISTYDSFYKLFELCTKSYVYNKLIITLDKGYIQGGYEIGIIKDIISEYRDAKDSYLDYLNNVWKVQQFMSDPLTMSRHLTSLFR